MPWTAVTTPVAGGAVSDTAFGIPVAGNMGVLGGAWTAYVPTTTNVTLGNGTLTARYRLVGKTIDVSITLLFGSTTALGGSPTFTLPAGVTALSMGTSSGDCTAYDTSANAWYDVKAIATSTTVIGTRTAPGTAGTNLVGLSSTVPFTWAVGDQLTITFDGCEVV